MATSSGTINSIPSAHLANAVAKSQKCLADSSQTKTTDFITLYVQSLQEQTENKSNEVSVGQKAGSGQQTIQGKVGGLNLRPVLKASSRLAEKSATPAKNLDVSPATNGRPWKYANVLPKDNLQRRPLHPESTVNTHAIPSSPSNTPTKVVSTPVIVTPHSSRSIEFQNLEKYAVCQNCGTLSKNCTYCDSCQKLLPHDVKMYCKVAEVTEGKKVDGPVAKKAFYGKNNVAASSPSTKEITAAARRESTSIRNSSVIREPMAKRASVVRRSVASSRTKSKTAEPVCLTISSDDEDEDRAKIGDSAGPEAAVPETENMEVCTTPRNVNTSTPNPHCRLKRPMEETENIELISGFGTQLKCRSVRIGSFKIIPSTDVFVSPEGIFIEAPPVQGTGIISLHICPKDLVQVMCSFGLSLPIMFLYTTPGFSGSLRNKLKMSTRSGPCYDPCSGDETQKRITLLPEKLTMDQRKLLVNIFSAMKTKVENREIMMEIDSETANSILVRSTPTELLYNTRSTAATKTIKMITYPPPPQKGGILITSDDYSCLEEGQFLNDVIIDFYLKYLVQNKLSEEDRERTHVFSSFFYDRLMRRPGKRHVGADDKITSLSENRHSRVKTWTRHVDIFEKDFIIIPINENAHWFLAVICYPYLEAPIQLSELENVKPVPMDTSQANVSVEADSTINSSIMNETATCEDLLADETLDCSQHSFDSEEPVPTPQSPESGPSSPRPLMAQPCILIFDSLPGPSRGRLLSALREYLRVEWQVKKKTIRTFDRYRIKGEIPAVPIQSNYSDCGVYLLQYVESFFQNPITNYAIPIGGLQNWFSDECVSLKRAELRQLIYDLMIEQHGRDLLSSAKENAVAENEENVDAKDENDSPDAIPEDS